MQGAAKKTIFRIELWHALLLLGLLVTLRGTGFVDATALILGGLFMGVNFLLLSFGIAWLLAPLAGSGRIKAGVSLLILKIVIFLGLLTALFFGFDLDPLSFALGFSTLIPALLIEALRSRTVFET